MVWFIASLMIIFSILIIAIPLFRKSERNSFKTDNPELRELMFKKENIYQTLKDLEFDFRTGKISEEDYTELRNKYRQEAMDILKEIDGNIILCPSCREVILEGDLFCGTCGREVSSLKTSIQ